MRDPWGQPLTAEFGLERDNSVITLRSAGPDKKRRTDDDFIVATFRPSYFIPLRQLIERALKTPEDYDLLRYGSYFGLHARLAAENLHRLNVRSVGISRSNRARTLRPGECSHALSSDTLGAMVPDESEDLARIEAERSIDKLNAAPGEQIRCSVRAERVGFRGYGMMLAEIGLPRGAEVDRASLESVLDNRSVGVDRYEVLPDRVVFYLWPTSGGAMLDFYLRARMPMAAKSGRSVLYDYYNPEALTEVAPVAWQIN